MNKLFNSKLFVILTPVIMLVVGIVAGVLLGFQPSVSGKVSGSSGMYGGYTSGSTSTEYVFRIEAAFGYWLFALMLATITLFLCIVIRNHYIAEQKNSSSATE